MAVQLETTFPSTFQTKWPSDLNSCQQDVNRSDMCYNPDFMTKKEMGYSPLSFPSERNRDIVVAKLFSADKGIMEPQMISWQFYSSALEPPAYL